MRASGHAPRFRKTLLALAASAALAPPAAQALDLVQAPPGTTEPYVAPNVILSLDDSDSMRNPGRMAGTQACDRTVTAPAAGTGLWPANACREQILKHSLIEVFSDTALVPDGKIRLAWQVMGSDASAAMKACATLLSTADASATETTKPNVMRALSGPVGTPGSRDTTTSRGRFLDCMDKFTAPGNTPTHKLPYAAHQYLAAPLDPNGPWAAVPGDKGTGRDRRYLACRRQYHILLTDGGWNNGFANVPPAASGTSANSANFDGISRTLPDGTPYDIASPGARTYRDFQPDSTNANYDNGPVIGAISNPATGISTIADWALYSWATPLQSAGLEGQLQPSPAYRTAPATETFTNRQTGTQATVDRYWNPKYDPATWPHLQTYTIGFSEDSIPKANYKYNPTTQAWTTMNATAGSANYGPLVAPSSMVPYGYDGSFADYANGTYTWRVMGGDISAAGRGHDMWHAALNGRGQFYSVTQSEDLKKAFRSIIGTIIAANEPETTSTATSGSNNTRNDVGKFTSRYEPKNAWKGFVSADTVKPDGSTEPAAGWSQATTADKLDATGFDVDQRLVLSWSDAWTGNGYRGGVPFRWDSGSAAYLGAAQKSLLGLDPGITGVTVGTNGQNVVNYVRGERSLEGSDSNGYTAALPFRQRQSRQGDIVNSVVWYTGVPSSGYALDGYTTFTRDNASRTAMLYVGGNDGMLHGFSAADGSERIAYVPKGVIPSLRALSAPAYNQQHQYVVDGSPMTGDVDLHALGTPSTPDWHTMLVGTLGAGGKGYFVLDVTRPAGFAEANAQQLVTVDRTRGAAELEPVCTVVSMSTAEQAACSAAAQEDRDIGHITAQPVLDEGNPLRSTQITRMNDNRWAVVMGNGYNSANQRPVLLIQYLDQGRELLRIPVTNDAPGTGGIAVDNGLAAPRLTDLDGDGRPDVAYAGDNRGHLWKFDLTSATAADWKVAFGGQPLFTAAGPSTLNASTRPNVQPITAPPTVRANDRTMNLQSGSTTQSLPVGGMVVAFGTGRNLTQNDRGNVQVQTLYAVLDNTRYRTVGTGSDRRLQVHPGGGTCMPLPQADCVPAPAALGTGVVDAKLAEQKITEVTVAGADGEFGTVAASQDATALTPDTWSSFNGWFLDFPAVGERLLKPMAFYDGSNILAVYSQVPAKGATGSTTQESCDELSVDEERQYRTLINIMDGRRPSVQLVDANGDGVYGAADAFVSRVKVAKGSHTWISGRNKVADLDNRNNTEMLARMPEQSLRPSWRPLK